MLPDVIVFDGGGTLWNSLPKLYDSYTRAFALTISQFADVANRWQPHFYYSDRTCHRLRGLPGHSRAGNFATALLTWMWLEILEDEAERHMDAFMHFVPDCPEENLVPIKIIDPMFQRWHASFQREIVHYETRIDPPLYPFRSGAPNLASQLLARGIKFILVSNRDRESTRTILGREGMDVWTKEDHFLDLHETQKEEQAAVADLGAYIEKLGAGLDATIWVGDSVVDMLAARNLQVPAIGLLGGMSSEHDLRLAGAAAIVSELDSLFDALESLV